jgi:hypothetical protein
MITHHLGVGLNIPIRLMICEDAKRHGAARLYGLPSSLMSRLRNDEAAPAAIKLDAKLGGLAEARYRRVGVNAKMSNLDTCNCV